MERNLIRNALSGNIDIEDLKYDIQVLITELNHYQSKTKLFVDAIKAQKNDLNRIIESQKSQLPIKGVYQ